MKNLTKIFMAVAAGLFAFSCVTDTTEDLGVKADGQGQTTLAVSLEQSRTQLGEKADGIYPLYWSAGDAIAVNGQASNALTEDKGASTWFTFNSEVTAPFNVVYPAVEEAPIVVTEGEGDALVEKTLYPVAFHAVQEYVAGNIANGAAPMYGYATSESESGIQLNHLTGIIRLAVKGNGEVVKSLTVQSEKGAIAGSFYVDCQTGALTAKEGATSNTVTMSFGEGITLGEEATPIYVAVPAGSYGSFVITLSTDSNKMTVKFNSDLKPVKVGSVREFAEFAYEANSHDSSDTFLIESAEDMVEFARIASTFYPRTTAKLGADIDMEGINWTPIENFDLTFDGNNHKISNLNAPLFGTTAATIKNLQLHVNIETASSAYYDSAAEVLTLGGLARKIAGPVSDCIVSGSVYWNKKAANGYTYVFVGGVAGQALEGASFTNVKNAANVTTTKANNTTFLGGIVAMVGTNGGTYSVNITNCENSGAIAVEEKNYSTETNRNSYLGGIAGSTYVNTTISHCKNSGAVTHNNAYTKNAHVGGIFGIQFSVKNISINYCENSGAIYSNTTCRENAYIGGVMGALKTRKTANMSNLRNSGTVTIEGKVVKRSIYMGGICGEFVNYDEDEAITVSNWHNSGVVHMNAGGNYASTSSSKTAYTLYLGGVFGNATRASIINFDNEGDVIYGKDGIFNSTVSSNPELFIGCIGGYRVTGAVEDCDNSGTLYLRASNPAHHHHIGGLFGQLNSYGATTKNCTNSGTIEAESTFAPKRCRLAGLFGVLYNSVVKDCVNSGAINYNAATTATNQMYIGGCIGYAYSATSGRYHIENLQNKGKITINTGTSTNSASICIAGIVGSIQKVYNDTDFFKNCVNVGDIDFNLPAKFTAVDIAGIIAHYNTTNANIDYSGHKQYSTIKALNRTMADIGAIIGVARNDARAVANCWIGGELVIAEEEQETGTDDAGEATTEIVKTPGKMTASNFFNYVYAGGANTWTDNTYDGCQHLPEKPTVTITTTPQPTWVSVQE